MIILVINAGSSSVKYQLFDMVQNLVLAKGICERIGLDHSRVVHQKSMHKIVRDVVMENHTAAFQHIFELLTEGPWNAISSVHEIDAVGHRVLHGGSRFSASTLIDEDVIREITVNIPLGPLHNPANLEGIQACRKLLPGTPMVAVFDTAFHQTLPRKAYLYALPFEYYHKYKIRKYGFHGTSYRYAVHKAEELLGTSADKLKLIICHLGNGASICAVKDGKCIDTSMGMSPLEGLVMGTRCGDIDPTVIEYICEQENKSIHDVIDVLNRQSGFLGLTQGLSSDNRDVEALMLQGDERGIQAMDVFTYRIRKYIGAYAAAMNGVDAIIFTGGIGEHSSLSRSQILSDMTYIGIELDESLNTQHGNFIQTDTSKVKIMIIPANEELAIAQDTQWVLDNMKQQ